MLRRCWANQTTGGASARLPLDARAHDMTLVPGVLGSSNGYRRIRAIESESASALRRFNATVLILVAGLLALSVSAQQRDPRIGEWREDYYPPMEGQRGQGRTSKRATVHAQLGELP